jgi:hypothetical protein
MVQKKLKASKCRSYKKYPSNKSRITDACGVVVRALASRLGDPSSNLTSAKIFINDLVELGPTQILHPCTGVKAGRETSNRIRV